MKILHALPALNRGGTERLVLALAAEQQRLGHRVVIATFDSLNLWPDESASLVVRFFRCTRAEHRLLRSPHHDADGFAAFLKQWQPEVIHSHSHWTERIVLACLEHPARLIQHFHLEYPEWVSPRWHQVRAWCGRWQLALSHWKHNTCFLAVSRATYIYYRRNLPCWLGSRLRCFPNFQTLPLVNQARSCPSPPLRFLSVGRLVAVKRHDLLFPLIHELIRCGLDCELHIAGDGPLLQDLKAAAVSWGVAASVHFCGNQQDMMTAYDSADLLLHPAALEPFGLVILEAMARGLPVLMDQACLGPREFVMPDANGLAVDFTNSEATAQRLIELLADPQRYQALSAHSVLTASAYSLDSYADHLLPLYRATSSATPPLVGRR